MNRLNHNWRDYEIEYLKENYLKMSNANIARVLQRSEAAIQVKKSVMRLTVRNDRKTKITEQRNLLFRLREAVRINKLVYRMRELIVLAENDHNSFRRDRWMKELKKLGELKELHISFVTIIFLLLFVCLFCYSYIYIIKQKQHENKII